jgi:hypothetical protein
MAYRIFFSGLMAFVEYHQAGQNDSYDQVDVLLLNPCARHGAHDHKGKGEAHGEGASCLDRHDPQLLVKSDDVKALKSPVNSGLRGETALARALLHEPRNQWLRGVVADLFLETTGGGSGEEE